jgi:uncharacterized protein
VSETCDVNLLVYASDEASPFHARAAEFFGDWLSGPGLRYLFWPVVLGYLRIMTHPAILRVPLGRPATQANITDLLALPHLRIVGELDGFWSVYRSVADEVGARGNLVPDTHLVALMRQHGVAAIWSHDRDLRKFRGITVRDPFAD